MTNSEFIRFSLRLWGEHLDPVKVTEALGLAPVSSYEKGYVQELSSGKSTVPKKLGTWVYEKREVTVFDEELAAFVGKFQEKKLTDIEGVQIVILDLYFRLSDNDSILSQSYECRLDNSILKKIIDLGVDVRMTIC